MPTIVLFACGDFSERRIAADEISQLLLSCRTIYQEVLPIFYIKGVFDLQYDLKIISKVPIEAYQMIKHVRLKLLGSEEFDGFTRSITWTELESITIFMPEYVYHGERPLQGFVECEQNYRAQVCLLMFQRVIISLQFPKITRAVELRKGWRAISDTTLLSNGVSG